MFFKTIPYWKRNSDWFIREPGAFDAEVIMKDSAPQKAKDSFKEWQKYLRLSEDWWYDEPPNFMAQIDWDIVFGREKTKNE